LIWISQIIRIIEFQYSISFQIVEVAITTLMALPSFINPLVPYLVLLGSFMINYKISSSNEIIIYKQYFSKNEFKKIYQVIIIFIFGIYLINNEFISKNFYEKYKNKELEIRNNLKLGSPAQNEFHIDDIISIFFDSKLDESFFNISAIIFKDNQFITSDSVEIELTKEDLNLVFHNGERLILNQNEKSKTIFDKFTFTLSDKKLEKLFMDKDHYNTYELVKHSERDFRNHGHNKIVNYILLIIVSLIAQNIVFFYKNKKNNIFEFSSIFLIFISIQIINSYLVYTLNNFNFFGLTIYYIINIIIMVSAYMISLKIIK